MSISVMRTYEILPYQKVFNAAKEVFSWEMSGQHVCDVSMVVTRTHKILPHQKVHSG